ncbi:Sugar phosphate permease [Streptomyces sp. WMMB 714]|uniref:MFS transporter n=1 Tax=Streptomyces sp. WMMB 714 TaxID=1286822 RepID=UPI000696DD0B|nr:MFS transporter [Streptomyces sp. WMMB 714]SCK53480.1 Sugar phosphate permease [Streptomyces sp. WMMB 714]
MKGTPSSRLGGGGFWSSTRARYLMPIAFVTYSLAYLDRSNYAIASAGGMAEELNLSAGTDSLIAASFFLGYFFFQIPGTIYAEQRSIRRLVAGSTIAWGVLATAQGLLSSPEQLIPVRFALGVVEGAVLPSLVVLLSRWFTKGERGRANSLLILGNPITVMWLSVLSGWLIEVSDWRMMFIIEGVPSIVWGLVCLRLIKDRPAEARWLPQAEHDKLRADLAAEQRAAVAVPGSALTAADVGRAGEPGTDGAGSGPESGATTADAPRATKSDYARVLRSRPVAVLATQYFFWSFGMYGFVFWLPSIVKQGSGEGIGATGLLSAIPYAFAVVAMMLNSRVSDRSMRRRVAVWPWLGAGAVALYASYLSGSNFPLAMTLLVVAGLCMYAPYGPYFALVSELAPAGVAGAAVAAVNSFGALGSFAGTYLVGWVRGTELGDAGAFGFMAGCTLLSAALMFGVREPRPAVAAGTVSVERTATATGGKRD